VAAFCDQRLLDVPSYTDKWRVTLNRDIVKKLVPSGSGA
jgi:DNA-binding ferritin-like protein (Dps family)